MIEYERIYTSDRIDVDKTNKSKESMLRHHWYFLHKNFSYGPYLCDDCYDFFKNSGDFKNIAIVHDKKNAYRIYFSCMIWLIRQEVLIAMTKIIIIIIIIMRNENENENENKNENDNNN